MSTVSQSHQLTTSSNIAEIENQAHELVRKHIWSDALTLYDQILEECRKTDTSVTSESFSSSSLQNSNAVLTNDQRIVCFLGRYECLFELMKYDKCVSEAKNILSIIGENNLECATTIARIRRRLIYALCRLKKFTEAEDALNEWIQEVTLQPSFNDISKTLERYKTHIKYANGSLVFNSKASISSNNEISEIIDAEIIKLDTKLEHWATNNLPLDKYSKYLTVKGVKNHNSNMNSNSNNSNNINNNNIVNSNCNNSNSNSVKQQQRGDNNGNNSNNNSSNGNNSNKNSSSSSNIGVISLLQKPKSTATVNSTVELVSNLKITEKASENSDGTVTCSYCAITCQDKNELRQHCQTETHQNVIMSDEGRDWKWRPPPRGFTIDSYSLCESFSESQNCHYGNQCVEAHGLEELNEWKERFEYRKMKLQKACEKELYGKSYTEELLEKWGQASSPDKVMCEKIEGVEEQCSNELVTSMSAKVSKREWVFILKSRKHLKAVALLQDAHRNHFSIKAICPGENKNSLLNNSKKSSTSKNSNNNDVELKSDQEWISTTFDKFFVNQSKYSEMLEHKIKITFNTEIFGTFRQSVCFDFGTEPVLVKHLCVDVLPVGDAEKIQEIKKDIISSTAQRWDDTNCNLVKFETTIGSHLKTDSYLHDQKLEKELLERYPCPRAATFTLTQSTIVDKRLTKNNYRSRIHELLYVEEIARYEQVARYNLTTKLRITSSYMLTPSGMATSTAKYSHSGELFGLMTLDKDISEDTSAGRLILSNCLSVYLSPTQKEDHTKKKRDVFEALIEDKGKNMMYLKLSAKCVQGMILKSDTDVQVDIQFQLNRLSYCEWHNAIDKITDFKIIFPDTFIEPNIPWTPKKQWSEVCDPKLNAKQKEAVNGITTPINCSLPPILLIGPFGTGKTFTLAQAIKQLLTQPESRILICTHSNSAADLYIKEYLHPWVEKGMKEAIPLRVYYHKRWVATVNQVVQKYCIIDPSSGNFRRPSVEDVVKHRIVVVTLNISMQLALLGLPKGFFTHIFLDEAAQAMECEAIMPLALAGENTRIVLAGDHMQMSPELFSNFAKERRLHISLLERLYDHYPSNFPCKILLCENYRAHEAIIRFTSELFYEQKLIASGKQPRHDRFYPLTFFTTRGEDVQDKNSTAFYNNSEVYEVVERVCELRKKWPSSWGKINDSSIGIMTPYADQVFRIRSELRKRRMPGISVERVLNVQGKQFRAVFLSTVRTRRTCLPSNSSNNNSINTDDADYGFLSNSKLLNTAITRAQSLVAVVGDPVALCSIGRCRKVWERFIDICNQNKSLFGITWSFLRSQLDGVELKRSYILNPLAPEFIPRALQPEAYLNKQAAMYLMSSGAMAGIQPAHPMQQQQHHHYQQQQPHHHHHHPIHSQQQAHQQQNNQISSMYGSNHHYNMMNQSNVSIPPQQHIVQKGTHQQIGNSGHQIPIRPPPNTGQPPPQQGYNLHGPPNNLNNAQQYSSYMMWSQQQQQQQHSNNQMMRPNFVPPQHPNQTQHTPQQIHPSHSGTNQQNQANNPNASLWGPPPQSNPWVLPKTSGNQPPSMRGPPGLNNTGNVMPSATSQLGQASTQQSINMNLNIRPSGNSAGPPILGPTQQASAHISSVNSTTSSNQPQSTLRNSHDISSMSKYMYQNSSNHIGPSSNFQNNQNSLVINQLRNQLQTHQQTNGPASPAAMQAAAVTLLAAQQQQQQNHLDTILRSNHIGPNTIGSTTITNTLLNKEKDYQFLNNVHNIPMNLNNPPTQIATTQQHLHQQNLSQYHDYSFLLPPNMNFYDMAFEPKESQYKWYLRLLELHGQEAANKFTEILKQVMCYTHNKSNSIPTSTSVASLNNFINQRQAGLMNTTNVTNHGTNLLNNSTSSSAINSSENSNANFYQQIDLVFNSLMNGNEISQPILRDLLGMVSNDSSNQNSSVNTNIPSLKTYSQPQPLQQQNQKNIGMPLYSNNANYLMNGNELGLSNREQSVPLYRRHALGSNNNSGVTGSNSSTSSIGTISNNSSTSTDYHSSTSSNNQSISSSTPDNLLENNSLANCGGNLTATGSNIYDALFNSTDISNYNNVNSIQKLFYNYSFKNECDMLLANNGSVPGPTRNTITTTNQLQHQSQSMPQQQHQPQQQQQHQQHHSQNQQHSHPPQQHTTYAAVLSQGAVATQQQPQQSSQQQQQPQQQNAVNHNNVNSTGPDEKDPFAAIRELGQRSNGFYNYFQ